MGKKKKKSNLDVGARFMCIDPGIRVSGVAVWDIKEDEPMFTDVIRIPKILPWQRAVSETAWRIKMLIAELKVATVICESMELWSGSAKSQASASKGDLFNLMYLVGYLGATVTHSFSGTMRLLPPSEWKGQLSKAAVMNRIKKELGRKYRDHEADAVGMCLYTLKRL